MYVIVSYALANFHLINLCIQIVECITFLQTFEHTRSLAESGRSRDHEKLAHVNTVYKCVSIINTFSSKRFDS